MKALELIKENIFTLLNGQNRQQDIDEAMTELEELDKELRYILSKGEESLSMGNMGQSLVFAEMVAILRNRYKQKDKK